MLEIKRIKEAESNVKNYLSDGLLKQVKVKEPIAKQVLIKNARESLQVSELLFKNKYSNLWTLVTSYYSMYYIAKALLYEMNYKVETKISHKVTSDALITYARKKITESLIQDYEEAQDEALELAGIKADELIESLDRERIKRERFQYSMTETIMQNKAKTSLERAKKFLTEIEKLL